MDVLNEVISELFGHTKPQTHAKKGNAYKYIPYAFGV